MSHYTTIKSEITDPEVLEKTIQDLGFSVEKGRKLDLYDYAGVKQGKADLVIRRKQLQKFSSDIGFVKVGDKFRVIISDWDKAHIKDGNFLNGLMQRYNYLKIKKETARQGLKLAQEKVREDGTIELVVATQEQKVVGRVMYG